MHTQSLDGTWQLRHEALRIQGEAGLAAVKASAAPWMSGQVPGEVHVDLMAAGLMEEPLVSTRAPACRWVEDRSWWYRRTFVPDASFGDAKRLVLRLHGVDYYAEIYLNDCLIASWENTFIACDVDVTHHLRAGIDNELVIRVTCGSERAQAQSAGDRAVQDVYANRQKFAGSPELRKPMFSYGWDWVDALPNIGLWKSVELLAYDQLRFEDLRTRVSLNDRHDQADLAVEAILQNEHPYAECSGELHLQIHDPAGRLLMEQTQQLLVPVGQLQASFALTVEDPALWWPNGMGAQPLYEVAVTVLCDGKTCDQWVKKIGLREISIDRSARAGMAGHRFAIQVNGQDVFCRGGNWIPADAILARVSEERYEQLIQSLVDAHGNMLRVWGGGVYENDAFYDICDRLGVLVWQDFMFACFPYPDADQVFQDKIRHEATAVIKRLRHHPCLALWCGNNENIWAFDKWWGNAEHEFPHPDMVHGGHYVYSRVLPEVCRYVDPDRPYWAGSPVGGVEPNGETEGDVHWWHNATMHSDISRRYRPEVYDECTARFVSEYGIIGPCHKLSMHEYLLPDERDVNHRAFKIHTNRFEAETTPAAITYHYADANGLSLDAYIRYGQMFQAIMYGRSIESLRFRKQDPANDCAGALIWMWNDCWGETGWTPIDYYLRRKASWYWIKNACYPQRALVRDLGQQLAVRVVNDSREVMDVELHCGWQRVDGSVLDMQVHKLSVLANSMQEVATVDKDRVAQQPEQWIFVAWLRSSDAGLEEIAAIWSAVPYRQLQTVVPELHYEVQGDRLHLTSDAFAHGLHHEDHGLAMLSDNYFDLVPGMRKCISGSTNLAEIRFAAIAHVGTDIAAI